VITMILSDVEIRKLILEHDPPLIEDYVNLDVQLQPAGFDLTLKSIHVFNDAGVIDFDNKLRRIPRYAELSFEKNKVELKQGSYLVTFNEKVNIPSFLVAIGRPRSSLLRSGATVHTALWDPGYRGRSRALLVVFNDSGITLYKNARLLQLVFFRLERNPDKLYSGIYLEEK